MVCNGATDSSLQQKSRPPSSEVLCIFVVFLHDLIPCTRCIRPMLLPDDGSREARQRSSPSHGGLLGLLGAAVCLARTLEGTYFFCLLFSVSATAPQTEIPGAAVVRTNVHHSVRKYKDRFMFK